MRDRHVIIAALVIVLALMTAPVWYARASGTTAKGPEPRRPALQEACVMPVEYMRTSHMRLLTTWRDQVVRESRRTWAAPDGRIFTVSLSGTCLGCHGSRTDFCDRCHAYAGVKLSCWDCHVDPASLRGSRP